MLYKREELINLDRKKAQKVVDKFVEREEKEKGERSILLLEKCRDVHDLVRYKVYEPLKGVNLDNFNISLKLSGQNYRQYNKCGEFLWKAKKEGIEIDYSKSMLPIQTVALSPLKSKAQLEVWQRACEISGGSHPTGKVVSQALYEYEAEQKKEAEKTKATATGVDVPKGRKALIRDLGNDLIQEVEEDYRTLKAVRTIIQRARKNPNALELFAKTVGKLKEYQVMGGTLDSEDLAKFEQKLSAQIEEIHPSSGISK